MTVLSARGDKMCTPQPLDLDGRPGTPPAGVESSERMQRHSIWSTKSWKSRQPHLACTHFFFIVSFTWSTHQGSPLVPTGLPGAEQRDDVPAMNHLVPERASGFPWIPTAVGLGSSRPFIPVPSGRDSCTKPQRERTLHWGLGGEWARFRGWLRSAFVLRLIRVAFAPQVSLKQ